MTFEAKEELPDYRLIVRKLSHSKLMQKATKDSK
jgi:hypothetical protein